jgi:flagellar hook-length control protein FliK
MNLTGINMLNQSKEYFSKENFKESSRPSSPFASILNKEVQQKLTTMESKIKKNDEEIKNASMTLFNKFVGNEEQIVEKAETSESIQESLQLLLADGLLPSTLNEDMLGTAQLSWLQMLPEDHFQKLQSMFKSEATIQDILLNEEGLLQVENLLASLVYIQHSNGQNISANSKDALLSLFQTINAQLQQLSQSDSFANQLVNSNTPQLTEELELFLSSIHSKLTGQNAIATTSNEKLDYLQSLFQRTLSKEEVTKSSTLQDSSTKGYVVGVENQSPINRIQQFALFVEQTGSKLTTQEQFIKEFQNLLAKSTLQNANGGMKLLIKLYPEHLGQLRVEIIQQQGILTARMVATTSAAKEMLESQLQGLKNAFTSQNIQVEKLEIVNAQSLHQEFERSLNKDSNQQGFTREGNDETKDEKDTDQSFETAFQEELMNLET